MTAMNTIDILHAVTEIAAAETGLPISALAPDADLRGTAGVDSVRVLRIIARIERTYDIELEDEDVFAVSTLAELADVVDKALREAV
ncbi:acyl carrier protein [Nocardia africana]|uniref:Acyl carrier protein n=1 Tax=Nocardia africana TaxID=134964 RepID=A0A378WTT7_9NOCA|nr:acyl carrier protein [Nocardia africana]MCC3313875.1 acyl carrier protein [Nocardia africana]SUA44740.1 acyl carrier protein [Nocardia africana]